MLISYGCVHCNVPEQTTVAEGLRCLGADAPQVLAAVRGGRVLEMHETIPGDGELMPITIAQEEGRRIYERSLRFVMLLAVRRRMPGQRVRVEHSAAGGVLVRLPGLHSMRSKWMIWNRKCAALRRRTFPSSKSSGR